MHFTALLSVCKHKLHLISQGRVLNLSLELLPPLAPVLSLLRLGLPRRTTPSQLGSSQYPICYSIGLVPLQRVTKGAVRSLNHEALPGPGRFGRGAVHVP